MTDVTLVASMNKIILFLKESVGSLINKDKARIIKKLVLYRGYRNYILLF